MPNMTNKQKLALIRAHYKFLSRMSQMKTISYEGVRVPLASVVKAECDKGIERINEWIGEDEP